MADCRNCKYKDLEVNTNPCKRCKLGIKGRSEWEPVELGFLASDVITRLMDDQVSYCLDDMSQGLRPTERLERLLDIIDCLCESHNQLDHLESLGVDNWENYEELDIYGEEEE